MPRTYAPSSAVIAAVIAKLPDDWDVIVDPRSFNQEPYRWDSLKALKDWFRRRHVAGRSYAHGHEGYPAFVTDIRVDFDECQFWLYIDVCRVLPGDTETEA